MLNFLNEANWWCLLLLLFLAFILGWILSKKSLKNKYKKELEKCEREKTILKNASDKKANSIFLNPDNETKPDQTRDIVAINEIAKPKLNFDSFGKADVSQKDDLKLISGVGPFIEKKLNSIGIYTFDQISKFTKEDIDTVTALIQFFPGRIERDKWTKQASSLKNK